jgi:hypothetical protein
MGAGGKGSDLWLGFTSRDNKQRRRFPRRRCFVGATSIEFSRLLNDFKSGAEVQRLSLSPLKQPLNIIKENLI